MTDAGSDVPDGAGAYTQALENIIGRISPRWGQHIDVEPGWYALIIEVDRKLSNVDPNYRIQQIKQKFGTLRYYCWPGGDDPTDGTLDAFESITDEAERLSAVTCERCGLSGLLCHQSIGSQVKTLCLHCAGLGGYERHTSKATAQGRTRSNDQTSS